MQIKMAGGRGGREKVNNSIHYSEEGTFDKSFKDSKLRSKVGNYEGQTYPYFT